MPVGLVDVRLQHVHAVIVLYESSDCECLFLADANNTFNHRHSLSIVSYNCYRLDIPLFIDGDVLLALEILWIYHPPFNPSSVYQVWYASSLG